MSASRLACICKTQINYKWFTDVFFYLHPVF